MRCSDATTRATGRQHDADPSRTCRRGAGKRLGVSTPRHCRTLQPAHRHPPSRPDDRRHDAFRSRHRDQPSSNLLSAAHSLKDARLRPSPHRSICEWKGQASYVDLEVGFETLRQVGWLYLSPTPAFRLLAGFVAFYAAPFDECLVDGEPVTPQPGGFYGGWITSHVAGPFKGIPGSQFW